MPSVALLGKATRARTLPVMLAPVAVGAALAPDIHIGWLAVTMAAAALMHLGANVLNDYFDARTGVDKLARIDRASIATGSGMIETGQMSERGMLTLAGALFTASGVAGVVIASARGWPVLAFGAAGALLAAQYVGPPLRLAYRGRGLGEVAVFVAFGLLPVAGSHYVQAGSVPARAWWAGVVPGLLTTLVLYHQNFLHWRADKAAGKVTPVVALGPDLAMLVSGSAIVIAYAALTLQVIFGLFPALALVAVATAIPLLALWARAVDDPAPQRYLALLGATLGTSAVTGLILVVALLLA